MFTDDAPIPPHDRDEPSEMAAARVRELLSSRAQPFWTTTVGAGIAPHIKIECDDIALMHALDDFLRACVREHRI